MALTQESALHDQACVEGGARPDGEPQPSVCDHEQQDAGERRAAGMDRRVVPGRD